MEQIYKSENMIGYGKNYRRRYYSFKNLTVGDLLELLLRSKVCSKEDLADIDNEIKPSKTLEESEQFRRDLATVVLYSTENPKQAEEYIPLFSTYFRPYYVEIEAFDKSWRQQRDLLVMERKVPLPLRKKMHKLADKMLQEAKKDEEELA